MSRVFNFSAGPAALPLEVLEEAKASLTDLGGSGMSVMEISHRSKAFDAIATEAEADLRELMGISDEYSVLFLQGGATQQFALLPMNLCAPGQSADYLVTGSWSKKAYKTAASVIKPSLVGRWCCIVLYRCAANVRVEAKPGCRLFSYVSERNHWWCRIP